jgi:hypothetical protein
LVVPPAMEEVARNMVTTIEEAKAGTFQPHRENDELTRAYRTPNILDEPTAWAWSHGKLHGHGPMESCMGR